MAYTLVRNGMLIDGNGGTPIKNAAVLIEDNKIRAVGTADSIRLPNANFAELDAKGGTILPGMIDTHVHITMEITNPMKAMQTPFDVKIDNTRTRNGLFKVVLIQQYEGGKVP